MLNINGVITQNQKDIQKAQMDFYKKLYEEQHEQYSSIDFFKDSINKLSERNKQLCEGKLTENECSIALKDMKKQKSPGSDGISTEFYKIFWNNIKQYLINSLNFSFENNNLTELQKQGLITLIPKQCKDSTILSNWRPITLLNVDYKIATKTMANRIKPILNTIISSAQSGFIKNRYTLTRYENATYILLNIGFNIAFRTNMSISFRSC